MFEKLMFFTTGLALFVMSIFMAVIITLIGVDVYNRCGSASCVVIAE